uniref:Carboxylic ester hydrolase n=1 Tax=Heterorhabditis bacteriophora TaxID=37862 RepID=A0A1I7XQY1_HETBA
MGVRWSTPVFSPVVETASGPVRGREYSLNDGRTVDLFLGIPYAEAPTGEKRFKKPEPVSVWSEVLDCIQFGPRCPQIDEYFAQYLNIVGKDEENCLTLNVFAPRWKCDEWVSEITSYLSYLNVRHLKVFRNLCSKDVVVVSINYRLGAFGFFTTGDDNCKGNMGLWDQTMALQWVNKNIRRFGGNPENVTLFGQSAGGASVDLLSLSPHSRDLFHRVIPMAGCGENDFAVRWKGNESDTEDLLRWMISQSSSSLEVGISPKKGFKHSQSGNLYFVPNYDGDFFPRPISELRKEAPHKSVMTGTTQWEGLFFGVYISVEISLSSYSYNMNMPHAFFVLVALAGYHKSTDGMKKFCKKIFKECDYGSEAEAVQRDIYEYYMKDVDPKDREKFLERFIYLLGDYAINVGIFNYVNTMAKYGHEVYFYSFEYCNPDGFGLVRFLLPFRGATHCTEIRYVLGKGIISKFHPNQDDHRMIKIMTTYFTNFAKYGAEFWIDVAKRNKTKARL